MNAVVIDGRVQNAIDEAVTCALANPVPLETIKRLAFPDQAPAHLALKDRPPGFEREIKSQSVFIPLNFRAAISFEHQPCGMCRHLSISVEDKPGKLPHPSVVIMIAEAFGFAMPLFQTAKVWVEEFAPGQDAVNVVQPVSGLQ